jgi:hypothetical protein
MGTDGDRRLTGPVRRAQPWQWAQGWCVGGGGGGGAPQGVLLYSSSV